MGSVLLACLSRSGIHGPVGNESKAGDLRLRLLGLRTGAHCFRATPWGSNQASKISWEFLEVGSPSL